MQGYRPVVLLIGLPSSSECCAAGDPETPIDLAKETFDPEGGSDDPCPCLQRYISLLTCTSTWANLEILAFVQCSQVSGQK